MLKREIKLFYKRSEKTGITAALSAKPTIYAPEDAGRDFNDYGRISLIETYKNDKGENKRVDANLVFSEVKTLARRVHEADRHFLFEATKEVSESKNDSPAYTVPVRLKPCSGLTPAQFLIDHHTEADIKFLTDCGKMLKANLDKDPNGRYATANKKQIEAIREALILHQKNELKKDSSSSPIVLFESPMRNKKTTNKNGKNLVYTVKVTYNQTQGTIEVTITNRFATIVKHEGRGQTFDLSNAEDLKELKFSMDMISACEFFDAMNDFVVNFENKIYSWVYDRVKEEEDEEYNDWKGKK